MNRHLSYYHQSVRLSSEKDVNFENGLAELLSETKQIRTSISQFTFHIKMDIADITPYFPIKCDDDILNFLQRDEEWNQRRKASFFWFILFIHVLIHFENHFFSQAFYHLLFNTVTKNKKRFAHALLHILFTREYIRDHKWPAIG